ncbi:hypothetical protein ACN1NW_000404 [Acinetobacter baumannii]|nr:hypothetical protein [Acinetobacter baumannii]ELA7030993.1 hypothetical protein [Acinetobacter baumannii]ELA7118756.1 hypothetical protein [Acinetobacter baumannii]ELB0919705.1 hypothetical protein [Acinetobacter baumannii]ELB0965881.1 hypothetical protein [Acinetobacter baumannii]
MSVNLTPKQVEILLLVFKKNTDGTHFDLDQLLTELSYKPTKQALQFSIRSLIKTHKYISKGSEKRRGRRHVTYLATPTGEYVAQQYLPKPGSSSNLKNALVEDETTAI